MQQYLCGYKRIDFVSDGGKPVKGTKLYTIYPDPEAGVVGQFSESLFVAEGFPLPELEPGQTLDITYNRRGKPVSISVVEPARK